MMIRRAWTIGLVATAMLAAGGAAAQPSDNGTPAPPAEHLQIVPNGVIATGVIASDGSPTMAERLFRDAVPSACASDKPFPGTLTDGNPFAYQTFPFTNEGPARCVTLAIEAVCSGGDNPYGAFLSAYAGPFDPTDPGANYLGDIGVSVGDAAAPIQIMRLDLSAGQTITLVVNQVNDTQTDPTNTCTFRLLEGGPAQAPAASMREMWVIAFGLAALGGVLLRRRAATS